VKKTFFAAFIMVLIFALACAPDTKQQEDQQKEMEAYTLRGQISKSKVKIP